MYFQRLRDLREDKDLRQEDVAAILGINQTVYSRYERGFQTIPVTHLIRLADFYGVTTDYILGRTNDSGRSLRDRLKEGRGTFKKRVPPHGADVSRDLPLGAPKGCTGWTYPHQSRRRLQAAAQKGTRDAGAGAG